MKFIKIGNSIFKKERIVSIRFDKFEHDDAKYQVTVEVNTGDDVYATFFIDISEEDVERINKEMLEE